MCYKRAHILFFEMRVKLYVLQAERFVVKSCDVYVQTQIVIASVEGHFRDWALTGVCVRYFFFLQRDHVKLAVLSSWISLSPILHNCF